MAGILKSYGSASLFGLIRGDGDAEALSAGFVNGWCVRSRRARLAMKPRRRLKSAQAQRSDGLRVGGRSDRWRPRFSSGPLAASLTEQCRREALPSLLSFADAPFPVLRNKIPVSLKNFPVPLSKELGSKVAETIGFVRPQLRPARPEFEKFSVIFPLSREFVPETVRSRTASSGSESE